jgi:molybdate transport system substrate-binding protein
MPPLRPALALLLACLLWTAPAAAAGQRLLVFAAASTTNALSEASRAFERQSGARVVHSFASSSTLAQQIAHGAPAEVYLSANLKWMDYLEREGALEPGTRRRLLANRLVLVAPAASPLGRLRVGPGLEVPALLDGGRLALGDPAHVPAGIYARQALTSLGLWDGARERVAAAANVRAALALVESGEAPLGVVYATDAAISRRVKVVGEFPAASHPPIVYPAALVRGRASPLGARYLEFLGSAQAAAVFRRHGFRTP